MMIASVNQKEASFVSIKIKHEILHLWEDSGQCCAAVRRSPLTKVDVLIFWARHSSRQQFRQRTRSLIQNLLTLTTEPDDDRWKNRNRNWNWFAQARIQADNKLNDLWFGEACAALQSTHDAQAPALVALPPFPFQERTENEHEDRKGATKKSVGSNQKLHDSSPRFTQMKFAWLRTIAQKFIAWDNLKLWEA